MKDKEVENYLTRQLGVTNVMWEEIAKGAQYGAKSAMLYFNALLNEGFSPDAAMKIICAHGCSPKWPWSSTTTHSDEDA